ncbi:RNA polymerase sigma factor [Amycolatopsis rhizosphaerae]|nr:sigma-70 family RNA polymerase sigma factor [Amycolatopsis rhizosphaerae]
MHQVADDTLTELPDEKLLAEARDGNPGAFAALFTRHHRHALRYARAIARSAADAEDLAAEALLRMMVSLKAGKGPLTNIPAYLRTTVRRLSVDVGSKTSRLVSAGLDLQGTENAGGALAGEEHASEQEVILEAAFSSLAPQWRNVLWMVEVLGYRPRDVAAVLDIAPAAVCSLLWRARKALRRRFEELWGEGFSPAPPPRGEP